MTQKLVILTLVFITLSLYAGKSNVQTVLPILAALQSAQTNFLREKPEHAWNGVNEKQQVLIKNYLPHIKDLEKLSLDELESCASRHNEVVNAFLLKHDCQVHLDPFDDPRAFGIASIMSLMGDWKKKGTEDAVFHKDTYYEAVKMNKGYTIISADNYEHPIIKIETKQGDIVSLVVADQQRSEFDLINTIETIRNMKMHDVTGNYQAVKFPMVDLTYKSDLEWLVGMNAVDKDSQTMAIAQALQETKFKMDKFGFIAKSAVILKMVPQRGCVPFAVLEIDKPFFAWIERKDMTVPLFIGYIDIEDWKKPKRMISK